MENKKDTKKSFLKNLDILIFFVLAILIGIAAFFGINDKMDYRFYDMFCHLRKAPAESNNITYCEIDDGSINQLGPWPWSRDIMADCLIHMKELGAERAVFDIEYLSPSNKTVNESLNDVITQSLADTRTEIIKGLDGYTTSVWNEKEYWKVNRLKKQFKDGINDSFNFLDSAYGESVEDNDLYFERALQFFGNSWLTVNTRDINIYGHDTDFVNDILLLKNVNDPSNKIPKNNASNDKKQKDERKPGFTPALPNFVQHSNGIGFTNVNIDKDGTRRRIELLHQHEDRYAAQLVFSPLLNLIDCKQIERKGNSLILKNVLMPGETHSSDIRIPLDSDGCMLINWRHGDFVSSFKHVFLGQLYTLEQKEKEIYMDLQNIISGDTLTDKKGKTLEFRSVAETLAKEYESILKEKAKLLSMCNGYSVETDIDSPITDEMYAHYFNKRYEYFKKLTNFCKSLYERDIYKVLMSDESTLNLPQTVKEAFWIELVGDFTPEEIDARIWDLWSDEEYEENAYRFGILTNLYQEVDIYNAFTQVLKPLLNGSFCIMGETASSTTDMGATPFINRYPNVGTHANVLNTILQKDFITPVSWWWAYGITVLAFGIIILIFHRSSRRIQNISGGIVLGAVVVLPILAMSLFDVYIPYFSSFLFGVLIYISGTVIRFVASSREKDFIKTTFSQFVSPKVVDMMIVNPEMAKLGGDKKIITALFSDIQKFSTFSEQYNGNIDPKWNVESLLTLLNEYLGAMSDVILGNDGTIDKFIGDSIVSLFGAPVDDRYHAYNAIKSAIRMKQSESEFNKRHMLAGDIPNEMFTRIGINTGEMIVGNMGTEWKKNYTMMGDNVNLASRLEGVNKAYKSWILCSESTWEAANVGEHKGEIVSRKLDRVRVVGRSEPTQLYNIIGFRSEMSRIQIEEIELFHEALDKYLAKKFGEAQKMFLQANELTPEDKVALVFAERCKTNLQAGVPDDWDGILNLTTK